MNIQQIGPDRLRVMLDPRDLDKYDLDYYSISKESPGTKRMLKEILAQAQKSGFSTNQCKLLLEVLPGKNSGCIIYLTKSPCESAGRAPLAKKAVSRQGGYVVCCDCLEDAIGAIGHFAEYPDLAMKSSSLFYMDEKYYLVFAPVALGLDRDRLVSLLAALSEYGSAQNCTPVFEAMLSEHGTAIAKSRAVECFIRYFH